MRIHKGQNEKRCRPEDWGHAINANGELTVGECSAVSLAKTFGTPLHVVHEDRLKSTAQDFLQTFQDIYPSRVSAHFAFKCNGVPAVIETVMRAGFKAEVMSEFELDLALRVGYRGKDIIVNGPCKPDDFLKKCLLHGVRLIVVDSLDELDRLSGLAKSMRKTAGILLRINPDYSPKGMNRGTATGSRKSCAFGLDLFGSEVDSGLEKLKSMPSIQFLGYHFHIGTGIRNTDDYRRALLRIRSAVEKAHRRGFAIQIFDAGGGFASPTTREMTTAEMVAYQGWERLPSFAKTRNACAFRDYAESITRGISELFPDHEMPELILEPGRSIASSNQLLLLTVHGRKERPGIKTWIVTDGGVGTVSMPTYYEVHEVFLCNEVDRKPLEKVTIIGPVCFAGDVVYRNKSMPRLDRGDVLAVMDSGAYFTSWESSFGFPRPAVVSVSGGRPRLVRRRETFKDLIARDCFLKSGLRRLHKKTYSTVDERTLMDSQKRRNIK